MKETGSTVLPPAFSTCSDLRSPVGSQPLHPSVGTNHLHGFPASFEATCIFVYQAVSFPTLEDRSLSPGDSAVPTPRPPPELVRWRNAPAWEEGGGQSIRRRTPHMPSGDCQPLSEPLWECKVPSANGHVLLAKQVPELGPLSGLHCNCWALTGAAHAAHSHPSLLRH